MEKILIYFACGLIGVLLHSFCKAWSMQKDAEKANIKFTFIDYLQKDWLGISISITTVLFWFLIFPEIVNVRPLLQDFVRISFGAMGFFGSYIIQYVLSKGKRYIRNVVDKKTDIADNVMADDIGGGGIKNPPPKIPD